MLYSAWFPSNCRQQAIFCVASPDMDAAAFSLSLSIVSNSIQFDQEQRARGNAKPSASAHICESIPGFCQVNRNAKPICQTIGKEIFKVFSKNKNAKPICKTIGVALTKYNSTDQGPHLLYYNHLKSDNLLVIFEMKSSMMCS